MIKDYNDKKILDSDEILSYPKFKSMFKDLKSEVGKQISIDFIDFEDSHFGDGEFSTDLYPPLISSEDQEVINKLYSSNPYLMESVSEDFSYTRGNNLFNVNDPWIQTFSGKRFTPTNPNAQSIVIQDIAHSLSMQCRFAGHCSKFYSVAQHSVLVSYLCNTEDALWGLLHDATEAYLVDFPSPLKKSGKFGSYIEFEKNMQTAICERFGLCDLEPESVKIADKIMLSTEARDLMSPRSDWEYPIDPAPFKIDALSPNEAEKLFLDRFYKLIKK